MSDDLTNDPFDDDWLSITKDKPNRRAIAENLRNIALSTDEPFRMMISGPWGSGKSWFVDRMVELFKQDCRLKVVYINAWKLDFAIDPFIAFVSEIQKVIKFKPQTQGVIKKLATGLAKGTSFNFGIASINGASLIEDSADDIGKVLLEDHKLMLKCREQLQKAIRDIFGPGKPEKLVFVIDELDRCEPRFAIDLMERIKHFFETQGVVVIASVDKKELCNTVRGAFGEGIDAERYLNRFYDVEYPLPKGDIANFAKLCLKLTFKPQVDANIVDEESLEGLSDVFGRGCETLNSDAEYDLRLRDIRQLVMKTKIVYASIGYPNKYSVYLSVLLSLIDRGPYSKRLNDFLNAPQQQPSKNIKNFEGMLGLQPGSPISYLFWQELEAEYENWNLDVRNSQGIIFRTIQSNIGKFPTSKLTPVRFARALYFAEGFNMVEPSTGS
ncbi:KAP family P-loop NTPase fold protein [Cerasicoccus frondis]|uniref:KAP family P-loop NTPase fold protein n=1 Tax=Cerasicoccus frondis TaxID=490090 RepID=UPI0028528B6A|nr:P-loop NTPase fold protein [Cerasicoccus frondis]